MGSTVQGCEALTVDAKLVLRLLGFWSSSRRVLAMARGRTRSQRTCARARLQAMQACPENPALKFSFLGMVTSLPPRKREKCDVVSKRIKH